MPQDMGLQQQFEQGPGGRLRGSPPESAMPGRQHQRMEGTYMGQMQYNMAYDPMVVRELGPQMGFAR
jgi:hypothetical protein